MRIVIATPTGHVGRAAVELLFRKGYAPVIVHRSPERVEPLVRRGARLVRGSLEDPAVIASACRGADAVLWVSPSSAMAPNLVGQYRRLAAAMATGFRDSGPVRIVNISCIGARHDSGTGPVKGLHEIEETLNRLQRDITHLRPGYYFENFLDQIPLLKTGRFCLSVPGRASLPSVATRDVAALAVRRLLDRSWQGHHAIGVNGPEDLTLLDIAASLARGLGRRIEFVSMRTAEARATMRALGIPSDSADDLLEFYAAIATGKFRFEEPRVLTAPSPTHLETFAREIIRPLLTR